MKTGVIMKSGDRLLFNTIIRQDTKTGFFNLSDLQHCFEQLVVEKGWVNKNIREVLARRENVERIYYILNQQNVVNYDISYFMEVVKNKGIATTLKSLSQYRTTGARNTKTVWCNPYIWIVLALELSPEFYANAVVWLTDQLIINRIEAGDFCVALNASIQKFKPTGDQYMQLAKALNHIVFGEHLAGIRNTGNRSQLKELSALEEKMAFAIDMGFINSFDDLLKNLRIVWNKKQLSA